MTCDLRFVPAGIQLSFSGGSSIFVFYFLVFHILDFFTLFQASGHLGWPEGSKTSVRCSPC